MLTIKEEPVETIVHADPTAFLEIVQKPRRRGRPSKDSALMCAICDFQAEEYIYLQEHMKVHIDKSTFPCPYCRALFTQKGNLQAHIRTHTKERPFKCRLCPFAATQKGNLMVHYRKHTKEKPYHCPRPDCDFSAAQVANLRSHLLRKHASTRLEIDSNAQVHRCCLCEYVCRFKHEMVDHVRLDHPQFYEINLSVKRSHFLLHPFPYAGPSHIVNF